MAAERFRDLGFELHYRNMRFLRADDVLLPSLGGTGQAMLGHILLELGLDYVDLARDVLCEDGTIQPATDAITRRLRPEGYATAHRRHGGPRFMKTHLPAEEFDGYAKGAVWLVIRDPRDALYSWHRYHRGFARLDWEHVDGSFEVFLRRPFFTGRAPPQAWAAFYEDWWSRCRPLQRGRRRLAPAMEIVRFEDLKSDPVGLLGPALARRGVSVSPTALARAADRSGYDAMREREAVLAARDGGPAGARIMRSGAVDGWREWMTPRLAECFADDAMRRVAARFGYRLPTATRKSLPEPHQ